MSDDINSQSAVSAAVTSPKDVQRDISLETVDLLDLNVLGVDDDEDAWLLQTPPTCSAAVDANIWIREGFDSTTKSPNKSLLQQLDQVVRCNSGRSKPYNSPLWSNCRSPIEAASNTDPCIDTRTFTRPKRLSSAGGSLPAVRSLSAITAAAAPATSRHPAATTDDLGHPEPFTETLQNLEASDHWSEVNSHTFTKSSPRVRKSLFSGTAPLFTRSGTDIVDLDGGDDGRLGSAVRCNGGEVALINRSWEGEGVGDGSVERILVDRHRLSDVSDVHVLARAQEARLRQLCSSSQPNAMNHAGRPGQQRSLPNLSNGNGGKLHPVAAAAAVSMSLDSPTDSEDGDLDQRPYSSPHHSTVAAAQASSRLGLRQPSPRSSFSSPDTARSGSPSPTKKPAASPATRSGIPRPSSTSKLPVHRKCPPNNNNNNNTVADVRRNSAFRPVDSGWREGCF